MAGDTIIHVLLQYIKKYEEFLIFFVFCIPKRYNCIGYYAKKYRYLHNLIYLHCMTKNSASSRYRNRTEYFLSVAFAGIIFYEYKVDPYSQY